MQLIGLSFIPKVSLVLIIPRVFEERVKLVDRVMREREVSWLFESQSRKLQAIWYYWVLRGGGIREFA